MPHPRRIPGSESATVGNRVVGYILNTEHWKGKHKARVFKSLGYTSENAGEFEAVILGQVANVEGKFKMENEWGGEHWEAVVRLPTTTGEVVDMPTYWEVREGEPPHLLTVRPPKPIKR